ncbi:MAG: ABC transporter permease [Christensenella sp.]|nr:ABC transporter permease [Christensenella sp.]
MTGTKRGWCAAALLGLFAVACWLGALSIASWLTRQYDGLSVRFAQPVVAQKDLLRAIDETPEGELRVRAAWTSDAKLQTASSALGTQTQLRRIQAYGDLRAIAPLRLLSGSFPVEDDTSGCLIDKASAWQLFHSTDAIGAVVTLGQNRYTVRGIADAYEPMLVIRGGNATYENLEFAAGEQSAAKQQAETFLYRCNAPNTYTLIESGLFARVARGFIWLCPCVFGIAGAIALFKSAKTRKDYANAAVPKYLASAVLLVIALAILLQTFYWPQSFLPTKWSDFGFWRDLVVGWGALGKAVSLMTPHPKEIQLLAALRWCAVLELSAVLFGGWCITAGRRICR